MPWRAFIKYPWGHFLMPLRVFSSKKIASRVFFNSPRRHFLNALKGFFQKKALQRILWNTLQGNFWLETALKGIFTSHMCPWGYFLKIPLRWIWQFWKCPQGVFSKITLRGLFLKIPFKKKPEGQFFITLDAIFLMPSRGFFKKSPREDFVKYPWG